MSDIGQFLPKLLRAGSQITFDGIPKANFEGKLIKQWHSFLNKLTFFPRKNSVFYPFCNKVTPT